MSMLDYCLREIGVMQQGAAQSYTLSRSLLLSGRREAAIQWQHVAARQAKAARDSLFAILLIDWDHGNETDSLLLLRQAMARPDKLGSDDAVGSIPDSVHPCDVSLAAP